MLPARFDRGLPTLDHQARHQQREMRIGWHLASLFERDLSTRSTETERSPVRGIPNNATQARIHRIIRGVDGATALRQRQGTGLTEPQPPKVVSCKNCAIPG